VVRGGRDFLINCMIVKLEVVIKGNDVFKTNDAIVLLSDCISDAIPHSLV
jgi:hypothetical protein